MAKRKAETDDSLSQRKRIKSDSQGTPDSQPSDTHSPHLPPLSPAAPEQSRKRKHSPDSQINTPEGPEAKRAKQTAEHSGNQSPDASQQDTHTDSSVEPDVEQLGDDSPERPRDATRHQQDPYYTDSDSNSDVFEDGSVYSEDEGLEVWPSIHDLPRPQVDEGTLFYERLYWRSYSTAMARIELLENPGSRRGPLPSPAPSDEGVGESHPTSIAHTRASSTTPEPLESQTMPAGHTGSLDTETSNEPSHQSPKKRRQRRQSRRGQGHAQDQTSSAAVEDFLRSKRSSRRDVGCTLWRLDDEGTACLVV